MQKMQEMRVQSLGCEDPLEKEMATHSSILAWEIPWTEKPGGSWGHKDLDTTNWLNNNKYTVWYVWYDMFSSVQFSHSVVSDSLRPHESQDARPPCPSPTPGVHSDSCPSSRWCHLILCRPLLLLPPIPPSIRVFSSESTLRMRWPKYWSFSFNISPSKEHQGLISLEWIGWISL